MHPIKCYLDKEIYKNYREDVIVPLFDGKHHDFRA